MPKYFGRKVVLQLTENCSFATWDFVVYGIYFILQILIWYNLLSWICSFFIKLEEPGEKKEPPKSLREKIRETPKNLREKIRKLRGGEQILDDIPLWDLLRLRRVLICLERSTADGVAMIILDEHTNRLIVKILNKIIASRRKYSVPELVQSGVLKIVSIFQGRPDRLAYKILKLTPGFFKRLVEIQTRQIRPDTYAVKFLGLILIVDWLDLDIIYTGLAATSGGSLFVAIILVGMKYGLLTFFRAVLGGITAVSFGLALLIYLETGVPICNEELLRLPTIPTPIEIIIDGEIDMSPTSSPRSLSTSSPIESNIKDETNIKEEKVLVPNIWRFFRRRHEPQVIIANEEEKAVVLYEESKNPGNNNKYDEIPKERITDFKSKDLDEMDEFWAEMSMAISFDERVINNRNNDDTNDPSNSLNADSSQSFSQEKTEKAKKSISGARKKVKKVPISERTTTLSQLLQRDQDQEDQELEQKLKQIDDLVLKLNKNGKDATICENLEGLRDILKDNSVTIMDVDQRIELMQKEKD